MNGELKNYSLSMSGKVALNLLFVEIYFLFRAGKSPFFFTLSDFVDRFSIEILYISLVLFLITGFIFPIAWVAYHSVFWLLDGMRRIVTDRIKVSGVPVFRALNDREKSGRVSVEIAKKYAYKNSKEELSSRIDEWEKSKAKAMEGEITTIGIYILLFVVMLFSSEARPNFLMGVLEIFTENEIVYEIMISILLVQFFLGRLTNFHLFRDAGYLPVDFFKSEEERKEASGWAARHVEQFQPAIKKWLDKH